ncbi:acetyl xylan esterase [Hymenobacter sediminis]|uniref:SGNH/GDSL hydrolase family protein n=1 Tax=Hymenobacter sediminis TaxID=2218621 RepID=UPI000DA645F2|nr:SGNH/GDSL hydrolase family protein [Hymenobacter sediminis]RPD44509.1 acetyl xylan esterase [Hymenobacter sediminis]
MMHVLLPLLSTLPLLTGCFAQKPAPQNQATTFYTSDSKLIQYVGRVDFSNPKKPRFWAPGVYVTMKFKGPSCEVILNDGMAYGKNNYLEVVLDSKPTRRLLTGKTDTVRVGGLSDTEHTLTICKNTEANLGYLEVVGVRCRQLLKPAPLPRRKIEFIGNSITCGTGADETAVPCGKGEWHDQHNAYLAYGPTVARALNAQWQLTAVSGIGLMRSCCNMNLVMPQIFDKVSLRENKIAWDFSRYQPDVVTVCLGQNDGIQDSVAFTRNYVQFLQNVRGKYPRADIVCLTSPMSDAKLTAALKNYLTAVTSTLAAQGERKVHKFFFSRRYASGCDNHPSLTEHQLIAQELQAYLRTITKW